MSSLETQLIESSRVLTDIIVSNIGSNQEQFDELMELMYLDKYPISMRAAWAAYLVSEKAPQLVSPHLEKLINALPTAKVDGLKRSALKMLCNAAYDLSEESIGKLADIAFTFAEDANQAIAIRAFSIDIIMKVVKVYPDITNELIAILESIMPDGSKGLKNKCGKLLIKLREKGIKHS